MVVGLDGCTFDIITPLVEQGMLPNFAELIQNGTSGRLATTIPPTSAPAWTTFQTGVNPGKHGVFDFLLNKAESYSYTPVNSTFVKAKRFWQYLSDLDRSVGLVNLLFTYPPTPVKGYVVSGKQTPSEQADYTYPSELKNKILSLQPEYQVEPFHRVNQTLRFLQRVPQILKKQEEINTYLLTNYPTDFFMTFFAVPDVIQHTFWRHIDPKHPQFCPRESSRYKPLFEKCFEQIDCILGQRMQAMDNDTTLVIMSDHGGNGLYRTVEINRWLQELNLLKVRSPLKGHKAILLSKLKSLAYAVDDLVEKFDVMGVKRRIKLATRAKRQTFARQNAIDWENSKAYSGRNSEQGIFINLKGREGCGTVDPEREYEELRNDIIEKLWALRDPESGNCPFQGIYKRESLYSEPYMHFAPDIVLDVGDTHYQCGDALFAKNVFNTVRKYAVNGKHSKEGILIAYGNKINQGRWITDAHIQDLAPTIMYAMQEKIPAYMDGGVLKELFNENYVKKHPVLFDESCSISESKEKEEMNYTADETQAIEKRLKDLGYM